MNYTNNKFHFFTVHYHSLSFIHTNCYYAILNFTKKHNTNITQKIV